MTMTEYITKEQAIEAMEQVTPPECFIEDTRKDFAKIIEKLPAADVAPVVHAEWEETGWDTWRCTNCDCEWQFLEGMTPEENDARYCPKCGARMDGEQP